MYRQKKTSAFTLIEVLVVVAIITLLATILVPTAGHMMEKARRTHAANNLRQVALAYSAFQMDPSSEKVEDFHNLIKALGRKTGLTDPHIWIQKDDPRVARRKDSIPRSIHAHELKEFPISIAVASYIPPHAPASTTPIAWTRGLQADGYWDKELGVYGNKGGFIAFLDGHVQWYDNTAQTANQLTKANSDDFTPNIQDAIGQGPIWEQTGSIN